MAKRKYLKEVECDVENCVNYEEGICSRAKLKIVRSGYWYHICNNFTPIINE